MASEGFQKKSLDSPDETRTFENGKAQVTTLGDFNASRFVFEPGWRWSENVKPIVGTDSCQVLHTGYQVSGRLHVVLDDGTEEEVGPGEAYVIPPGPPQPGERSNKTSSRPSSSGSPARLGTVTRYTQPHSFLPPSCDCVRLTMFRTAAHRRVWMKVASGGSED